MKNLFHLLLATAAVVWANNISSSTCASLTAPDIANVTITSFEATERRGVLSLVPSSLGQVPGTLNFCNVTARITHGSEGDDVIVQVWLPLEDWNGRFQGTGGIGFKAGMFSESMMAAVEKGFAVATTDAGVPQNITADVFFSGSQLNQVFTNFAELSVHEMAVFGKTVTSDFYGRPPSFSYMNGCSTGGRQGMKAAQKFPDDFDGILAVAPALYWSEFLLSGLWPFVVANAEGEVPPPCVMDYFVNATVSACDSEDGASDSLVSNPGRCGFDPQTLVGGSVECNGTQETISTRHATTYGKILQGPLSTDGEFLWYGFMPGAQVASLAGNEPPSLPALWFREFIERDSSFDFKSLNYEDIPGLLAKSKELAGSLETTNPDLSSFKTGGGKIITWHGLADPLIPPNGTFHYYAAVAEVMGGMQSVGEFYRVFSAPGVVHCGGGAGPEPIGALDALIAWVEEGVAPESLAASKAGTGQQMTRNLCRYPLALEYNGQGSVNDAENWECRGNIGDPAPTGHDPDSGAATGIRPGNAIGLLAMAFPAYWFSGDYLL